jgi:hypothetical protein
VSRGIQIAERAQEVTCDNTGLFSVNLGGPVSGRRWDLRRFAVVDATDPTVIVTPGSVLVITTRSPSEPLPTEVDIAVATGIPVGLPLEVSVILLPGEELVIAGSVSANRTLIITAMALDHAEAMFP